MGFSHEVLDRFGDDARARRQDQLRVRQCPAVGQMDRRLAFVHPLDLTDDERDPLVEERALGSRQPPAAFSPPIAMYMKPGW